jgi:SAM-dependent methyltransferase
VRFDLPRLGEVRGLRGVHLQCHIGTDTVSLARLGARMTGVDFSPAALAEGRGLAERLGLAVEFVESDVYSTLDVLEPSSYDLVFTGIGALCWLPDIRRWAAVVAALLRPGGRLFMREGHPVLWSMCDPRPDGLLVVEYPYFEVAGGTEFTETTTYVAHEGELAAPDTIGFNHGLGEIVGALLAVGMRLTMLDEHDSVPWNPLGDAMVETSTQEWQLRTGRARMPLTYTVQAVKE